MFPCFNDTGKEVDLLHSIVRSPELPDISFFICRDCGKLITVSGKLPIDKKCPRCGSWNIETAAKTLLRKVLKRKCNEISS